MSLISRRRFLRVMSAVGASTAVSLRAGAESIALGTNLESANAALLPEPLYQPMDLSYFDKQISPAAAEFHLGYASITWPGDDPSHYSGTTSNKRRNSVFIPRNERYAVITNVCAQKRGFVGNKTWCRLLF